MYRKDREMPAEFALGIIDKCPYAVMAVNGTDGKPYCLPLSISREGDYVYFHCAAKGYKLECLNENPYVCVTCVGDVTPATDKFTTEYESAVFSGHASEVTDKGEKIMALRSIALRYTPSNMSEFDQAMERSLERTHIWKIKIEALTGKRKKYDKDGIEMKHGRME